MFLQCVTFIPDKANGKKKKDNVTEMSILTVHSWVLALRKLMASQAFTRTV